MVVAAATAVVAVEGVDKVLKFFPYTARGGIDREPFFSYSFIPIILPLGLFLPRSLQKILYSKTNAIQSHCDERSMLSRILLLATLLAAPCSIHGAVIFESTALGTPSGSSTSMVVTSNASITQFVGTRFGITQQTLVTSVGGYMAANGNAFSPLFAAIVSLNLTTGLPTGSPFTQAPIVSTTFLPNPIASDIRAPIFALLNPGTYGLIFGSGLFGSPQGGEAWLLDPGSTSSSSYFAWTSVNVPGLGQSGSWSNISGSNPRFFVEGTPFAAATTNATPEPATNVFVFIGLACIGSAFRIRRG